MNTSRPNFRRRRYGAALIYVVIVMVAMMGLCSLAVDLGRYEFAHSQLYNSAEASARVGAMAMTASGATANSVTTAVTNAAIQNSCDGQTITSAMVTVQFVNWNSTTNTGTTVTSANFSQANAVRVYISYTVPLMFAQALGMAHKTAVESSTAMYVKQVATPYVVATGDPWLAGEPTGTQGSQADPNYAGLGVNSDHMYPYDIAGPVGSSTAPYTTTTTTTTGHGRNQQTTTTTTQVAPGQPYSSPVQVSFTVTPGATITITNASGTSSYDGVTAPWIDPTGNQGSNPYIVDDAAANGVSEHGMSDLTMPCGGMNGVFLGSGLPDSIATVPAALDFSTQAERDYVGIQPKLQQPFYVGNGQTSGGTQQEITVPQNATRLFLGVMDGWEWDNNSGGFNCTVTQVNILTVQ